MNNTYIHPTLNLKSIILSNLKEMIDEDDKANRAMLANVIMDALEELKINEKNND